MARCFSLTGMVAAIAALGVTALPLAAQTALPSPIYVVLLKAGEFGSQNYTNVVTGNIAAAQKFCGSISDKTYVVDCLAERLGTISKSIPTDSDYAEVKQIMKQTSDKLAELARANRNPAAPSQRLSSSGARPQTTSRPLTAVTPTALPSVNRQATAILDETSTLLLRSGRTPDSKLEQYARIADAIGSNKVLLRSA